MIEDEENNDCAEEYEHGCEDCKDYTCPYRDTQWVDPTDKDQTEEHE